MTDGTGAGTSGISVAGADTAGFGLEPGGFTLLGSEVLFNGTDALSQQNLWMTDGTSAGTFELSIANAASVGAGFFQAVVFGSGGSSEVLYASADLNNLGGLWVTDGTTAGTSELSVAGLGQAQDSPGNFVAFGSLLLFEGADANGHLNLWQTDGTAGGTSEVSVPGASSLGLFDGLFSDALIFPFGSEVLFTGNDSMIAESRARRDSSPHFPQMPAFEGPLLAPFSTDPAVCLRVDVRLAARATFARKPTSPFKPAKRGLESCAASSLTMRGMPSSDAAEPAA